ncbi:MAG: DNA mismatch repair protein MutS, partial [Cyclobacteriaceae bacterium]
MNIGDRVRMMKGSEEGVVVRFLQNDLVEVEIEDGFQIPVLKRELVVISAQEDEYFGSIKPRKEVETSRAAPKVR